MQAACVRLHRRLAGTPALAGFITNRQQQQHATGSKQPASLAHLVPCRRLQFVTQSELNSDVDNVSLPVQAQSEGVCVCVRTTTQCQTLATCHLPLRHLPLALTFQPKYTKKKNPNANENETNVGVKMKTFVRKRENSLSV